MQETRAEYLLSDELPKQIGNLILKYGNAVTGSLKMPTIDFNGPYRDLRTSLHDLSQTAFITVGRKSPSYTTGVFVDNGRYYVFDPHSRDLNGLSCPDGKAVLTCHEDLDLLTLFLAQLSSAQDELL